MDTGAQIVAWVFGAAISVVGAVALWCSSAMHSKLIIKHKYLKLNAMNIFTPGVVLILFGAVIATVPLTLPFMGKMADSAATAKEPPANKNTSNGNDSSPNGFTSNSTGKKVADKAAKHDQALPVVNARTMEQKQPGTEKPGTAVGVYVNVQGGK